MGLTYPQVHQLLAARRDGAAFETTLTIGHQTLVLHPRERARLTSEFALSARASEATGEVGDYADGFLREALGVADLQILDASDYEGATIVHDLNLPSELAERFDAVVDGGSLEHVFNVPVALATYMRALKVGGHLFLSTPANSLCGHGFYQFSPEFAYRAFGEMQGFRVVEVKLTEARYPSVELTPPRREVAVADPQQMGERILLASRRPVMLVLHAQKLHHHDEPFAVAPQQSDYDARWSTGRAGHRREAIARLLPNHVLGVRERLRYSLLNRRFYRPLPKNRQG